MIIRNFVNCQNSFSCPKVAALGRATNTFHPPKFYSKILEGKSIFFVI